MKKLFKIAKVVNSYKVVINAGSNQGIKENQRFLIYSLDGETIFDPDTNEPLGQLEITKGTGIVTFLHENMATIESDMYSKYTPTELALKNTASISASILTGHKIDQSSKKHVPFKFPNVGDFVKPV